MPDDPRYSKPRQFLLPPSTSGPPVSPLGPFYTPPGHTHIPFGVEHVTEYPIEIPMRAPEVGPLLSGMGNMYSPGMGAAGWELLTHEEKRAWWEQADEFSKDHLRAALEESRVETKKLGAPHTPGPYKSRETVRSLGEVTPLEPGVAPMDVQRPTEKIMTGPQRQAMELEVSGTPGREPTIPPPDIAARDAELFGVGELDVAMDQAMTGGILRDELVQYGDEFQGIYQYFKSRGVPEDKITKFWRRTINEMGDFEGKAIWKVEGTEDLINTQTGEVVQGLKDPKGRHRIYRAEYTGSQPTEEKMLKEKIQELIDGGMHRLDAEIMVREKGVTRRTPEQQAFVVDDPVVVGKSWQAKPGTPAYDMVTEKAEEWASQHGTHPTSGQARVQTDDPRSRASTEHPRFTELHKKRLAELRAATQAEAKIGQTIALDPITGQPGFPGQKFFGLPGDFPDPIPDPPRGQSRPSGMEQFLRDINAGGVEPLNRMSLLERLSREGRGPLPDLTNLTDSQLSALSSDLSGRVPAGTATMTDAMDLHDVMEEIKRRDLIKAGEGRISYPRPRPGIETDLGAIIDDSLDIQIAGDAAGRRSQSLPATKTMLEGSVGPHLGGPGGPRVARFAGDQPSLPGMSGRERAIQEYIEITEEHITLSSRYDDLLARGGSQMEGNQLVDELGDLQASANDLAFENQFSKADRDRFHTLAEKNVRARQAVEPDMPFVPRGKRTAADYLAKNFTTDELHAFLKDLEARPSPYVSWGKEEIDQFARDVRAELARRSPTELAGPGELTGGTRPPGEPPVAPAAGGADDFFPNNQSLNDAVNEFRAAGMTDEAAATFKAKALKKPKGWFPELTTWLRGKGGMGRASMFNLIDDVISTMRGTTLTLGQAATTPMVRTQGESLTDEEKYIAQEEMRLEGEADVIHKLDADDIQNIVDTDAGALAREQAAAETPLPQRTAEDIIRAGDEAFTDAERVAQSTAGAEVRAEAQVLTSSEDIADAAPVETAAQTLTNNQHTIVKRDLDIMVDEGFMSAGERASHLDDLLKGETRIMEKMTVAQQKSLLRLMGETRTGHWATYEARNAAYKKLIASNTLSRWALTKELLKANPSFRLSMKQAVGWGMTAAERTAAKRGAVTLLKNIGGRTTVRGMNIAGRAGRAATGWPGMLEMAVTGGQLMDDQLRGAGHRLFGGYGLTTPLQINVGDLDEEVARRLADKTDRFPWTRPHVLLEILVSRSLINDDDAEELVLMLDRLIKLHPGSDEARRVVNTFNTKLGGLLENPAYEYGRSVDFVKEIPFQTKTDLLSRIPVLNLFTDPYLLAGQSGAEAPGYINWAKNPRSLSRKVDTVRIKATAANAMESGHISPQLAIMVAPDLRYQRVEKDEGLSSLDWRLLEGVSIEGGGVPHARKDVLHELLTEKPPGWREGESLGRLKLSDSELTALMEHPQGRKLMMDLQAGKIIAINPETNLPYRPRDRYTVPPPGTEPDRRARFDPNVGTPPPDYKWIQASDKYSSLFETTFGYNRAPTWAAYDKWKATKTSQMDSWSRAFRSQFGSPMGLPAGDSIEDFFAEFEGILDEMQAAGVVVAEEGVEILSMNMPGRKIPNPLVRMYTGQEVRGGAQQRPRYSFVDDFDETSRAYQKHLGYREMFPRTRDPNYFIDGRELLKTGGGRY